jgi:hypothetical protein
MPVYIINRATHKVSASRLFRICSLDGTFSMCLRGERGGRGGSFQTRRVGVWKPSLLWKADRCSVTALVFFFFSFFLVLVLFFCVNLSPSLSR